MTTKLTQPLPSAVDVAIIGGGIQGLACAFNLAERGVKRVLVVDAGYWQGGASGRNGCLIRGAFGTPEWTELFRYGVEQWAGLSKRLGRNVMFTRRGYTMIAERDRTADVLVAAAGVHRQLGVRSSSLDARGLKRVLPAVDTTKVAGALHLPESGVAPHHAAMKALFEACEERGVDVRYRVPLSRVETINGRAGGIIVGDQLVRADTVLVAAGAHNLAVAQEAGLTLPGHATRLEIMALEPLRPFIKPGIALIDSLCYLHQTARGEIVGAAEAAETPTMTLATDVPVLATTASVYARMFPRLGDVRILRHWAGVIHATPDYGPLLGEHPGLPGLWFSAGWSYGFAGGPGAGALLAKAIVTGVIDSPMRPFTIDRFDRGAAVLDPTLVL